MYQEARRMVGIHCSLWQFQYYLATYFLWRGNNFHPVSIFPDFEYSAVIMFGPIVTGDLALYWTLSTSWSYLPTSWQKHLVCVVKTMLSFGLMRQSWNQCVWQPGSTLLVFYFWRRKHISNVVFPHPFTMPACQISLFPCVGGRIQMVVVEGCFSN